MSIQKRFRVNRWVRSPKLRVIGDDGEALGILDLTEALRLAEEKGLDLVEVSPNSQPPVAKIMDYGKFKYTMEKRDRESRKKSKAFSLKEVKLRSKIDIHDFVFKKNHAAEFLKGGHKVKLTVTFFGREMTHIDLGKKIIDKMIEELAEVGKVEMLPKLEGRNMSAILVGRPVSTKIPKVKQAGGGTSPDTGGGTSTGTGDVQSSVNPPAETPAGEADQTEPQS